jgi:hypothetical protein
MHGSMVPSAQDISPLSPIGRLPLTYGVRRRRMGTGSTISWAGSWQSSRHIHYTAIEPPSKGYRRRRGRHLRALGDRPAAHARELRQGRVMPVARGRWSICRASGPDPPIHKPSADQSPSYYWDRSIIPGRAFYGQNFRRRPVPRDMHIDRPAGAG